MLAFKTQLASLALLLAGTASARVQTRCPNYATLLPRYQDYRKHCEAEAGPTGSDPKWPCFTLWSETLKTATGQVEKGAPDDLLLVKDGFKTEFTTRDPNKTFTLLWSYNDVSLTYSDYNHETGCYKLTLKHNFETDMRIWVSDEANTERNADTKHHSETSTVICTKWTHIHVKNEG